MVQVQNTVPIDGAALCLDILKLIPMAPSKKSWYKFQWWNYMDDWGNFIKAYSQSYGIKISMWAEYKAALKGLRIANGLNLKYNILEIDSQDLVNISQRNFRVPWELWGMTQELWRLLRALNGIIWHLQGSEHNCWCACKFEWSLNFRVKSLFAYKSQR